MNHYQTGVSVGKVSDMVQVQSPVIVQTRIGSATQSQLNVYSLSASNTIHWGKDQSHCSVG